jgi:hypothetical protein
VGVFVVTALVCAAPTSAHTYTDSLGSAASATDFYQVTCSDDGSGPPASLFAQVRDEGPVSPPWVSVQLHRGSLLASSSDPIDGDTESSPSITVNGGPGVYDVLVDKSGAGSENYTLTFHCMTGPDGTGVHTGTAISVKQNQ